MLTKTNNNELHSYILKKNIYSLCFLSMIFEVTYKIEAIESYITNNDTPNMYVYF